MDFGLITTIAGALGLGTVIGNVASSYFGRKEKRVEREAARDEAHRDQLRHAYSEFIATYSHFLDTAGLMHSINRAIAEMPDEAFHAAQEGGADMHEARNAALDAVTPALQERGRKAIEDFAAASTHSNTKAIAVLLIDDDVGRRERLLILANAQLIPPQTDDDYQRFLDDITRLRRVLDELTAALGGAFSPDRWHRELAKRRALPPGKQQQALPPGT